MMNTNTPHNVEERAETPAVQIRAASDLDVPEIIRLLWNDDQGRNRESIAPDDVEFYQSAFHLIEDDPNSQLLVAIHDGVVVGCLQLTIIPGLSYRGVLRALIEDVRVNGSYRNRGIGRLILNHAEAKATELGCGMIELFVHTDRNDTHRFYERAGYIGAHKGFRKSLS